MSQGVVCVMRLSLAAAGLAVIACLVAGCGGGEPAAPTSSVVIGQQSATFTMGLGAVKTQGVSVSVNGVRLGSEDSNGRENSGVFPLPADENAIAGNVRVQNGTGGIIKDVLVRVTSISTDWVAETVDYGGGVQGWAYGAIGPVTGDKGSGLSSPLRWVFRWTGAGAPAEGSFTVEVTWNTADSMPTAGSATSILLNLTAATSGSLMPYEDVTASTSAADVDDFDDAATDAPRPPDPPSGSYSYIYFPHPEWRYGVGEDDIDYFVKDARALLYPGQTKGWDFVFKTPRTGDYTIEVDASTLPVAYGSVKVVNLQTGATVATVAPGATGTFTHTIATGGKNVEFYFQLRLTLPSP